MTKTDRIDSVHTRRTARIRCLGDKVRKDKLIWFDLIKRWRLKIRDGGSGQEKKDVDEGGHRQ